MVDTSAGGARCAPLVRLTEAAITAIRGHHDAAGGRAVRLDVAPDLEALYSDEVREGDVEVVVEGIRFVMDEAVASRLLEVSLAVEGGAGGFLIDTVYAADQLTNEDLGVLAARELVALLPGGRGAGRVLLADAEPAITDYVGALLASAGFEATAATTPEEAEAALKDGPFAFVMVDFMDDRAAGLRALSRLKAIDSSVPIVLFTNDRIAARAACAAEGIGLAGLLGKPFDLETELAPLLARLMERGD